MPRPTGLTRPQIGSGRASPGTVDVTAWSNPDQGTDGLRVHIEDPSRAHMAATVGIVDAGGYYLSDEVEGALQEIGGASSGGRQNGVVTGFGYAAVGLTVTFDTPSTALLPTLRTYSGEAITLPDNTPSVWVYISPATGLITQFVGANPPSITAPENVLLWQFTTLAGAVTAARDARLYVRNIDRKLPFTVRSVGSQANQESEACFVTLDAALTYLQFSAVLGSNRSEVVVRGPVVTGPIDIPVSGIHFRGEDGASITLTNGTYLFDTRGRDGVTFSDIAFKTDVVNATAVTDSVGTSSFLTFQRCSFTGGTTDWEVGIFLTSSTGRLTVSNCSVLVTNVGIRVFAPAGVLIDQTEVNAVNFLAGSEGIRVGVFPTSVSETPGTVRSCTVTGFDVGIRVSGIGHTVTANAVIVGSSGTVGIRVDTSQDVVVSGNRVDCSANAGKTGIVAIGTSALKVTSLKVVDNTVFGATTCGIELRGFVQESSVRGNQVDCLLPLSPNDPTAFAGIFIHSFGGPADVPAYNVVSGNTVWRANTGIYLAGSSTQQVVETVVSDNVVHHCAVGVAGAPGPFQTSVGIGAEWCVGLNVSGNNVYGIGRILTDAGTVVDPTPANVYSGGIYLEDCDASAVSGNQVRDLYTKGAGTSFGIRVYGYGSTPAFTSSGTRVTDNGVSGVPGTAIQAQAGNPAAPFTRVLDGAIIANNTVNQAVSGIEVVADGRGTVSDLRIEGNSVGNLTGGVGIGVLANDAILPVTPGVLVGVQVVGNTVDGLTGAGGSAIGVKCADGASTSRVAVERNAVRFPGANGIEVVGGSPIGAGANLFEYISVLGNDLRMSGGVGFKAVNVRIFATSTARLDVSDNTITNTDSGVDFLMSGPAGTEMTVTGLSVRKNAISATARGVYGVITGFLSRYTVSENTIQAGNNVLYLSVNAVVASLNASIGTLLSRNRFLSVPNGTNVQLLFVNQKVLDLRVEDNTFLGGTAASTSGLAVTVNNSSVGTTPSVRGLSVRRNLFRDMDCRGINIAVDGLTDPVVDTSISDNTFENLATNAALARASVIRCDINASVRNMAVRNNQFAGFGHNTTTHGGIDLTVAGAQGLDVSGNQFDTLGAVATYGNIVCLETTANPLAMRDLSVCRNKVRSVTVPPGASNAAHISLELSNFTEVSNISVCDNDVDRIDNGPGSTEGIRIYDGTSTAYGVSCDRNRVTGTSVGALALNLIFMSGANDVSVCGNHVMGNPTAGASGGGIQVSSAATSVAVRVSDNTVRGVDGTGGNGILVQTSVVGAALNGSYVERNYVRGYQRNIAMYYGSCTNLSVSGNDLVGHTISGIFLSMTGNGGTAYNLSVDGNKVTSSTDAQSQFIGIDTSDSNNYENLSVCDNTLRYSGATIAAGYGIFVRTGTTGTTKLDNANLCRNRVRSVTDGLHVFSRDTLNVRIDENELRDVVSGIQHQFTPTGGSAANVTGYSVSRNTVAARDNSTAKALIYLYHDSDAVLGSFYLCNVDGNSVGCIVNAGGTLGADAGIRIGKVAQVFPIPFPIYTTASARSVSVSGNTVRSCNNGIDVFFAAVEALSIDNNKVSEVQNGVSLLSAVGQTAGDTFDLSFSHNSVTKWGTALTAGGHAFGVLLGNSATNYSRDMTFIGNSCYTNLNDTIGWDVTILSNNSNGLVFSNNAVSFLFGTTNTTSLKLSIGTGTGAVSNYAFTGNVFRRATLGIVYSTTGYNPNKCTFMGNIGGVVAAGPPAALSWSQFENGGTAGWTNVLPPAGAGAGQFQNFNIDNGT